MNTLILHHYAMSPFSQKSRSMLGYAGLQWLSVITREMPPRPFLEHLTGGYRKIPVAQIGADIFCDTRTIATEIARLAGHPELALENCAGEVQARQAAQKRSSASTGSARNNVFAGARSPSQADAQASRGRTSQVSAQRPNASRSAGNPISRPSNPPARQRGGRR